MSEDAGGAPSAPTVSVDVSGRVAIVTGSGGRIGQAVMPRRDRAAASGGR
jgi:hypothetical protein